MSKHQYILAECLVVINSTQIKIEINKQVKITDNADTLFRCKLTTLIFISKFFTQQFLVDLKRWVGCELEWDESGYTIIKYQILTES